MTREEMIREYQEMAAAHKYLVGFQFEGSLYYTLYSGMIEDKFLKLDRMSSKRGGYAKIRVRLDTKSRLILVRTNKAVKVGSAKLLNTNDKYNLGERFERLMTETLTDTKWEKDKVPFTVAGDIRLYGEEIQIKFDGAELTNEKTLRNLRAA